MNNFDKTYHAFQFTFVFSRFSFALQALPLLFLLDNLENIFKINKNRFKDCYSLIQFKQANNIREILIGCESSQRGFSLCHVWFSV